MQDYLGRTVTFTYDANGNLNSVTTPGGHRHAHRQQFPQRHDHALHLRRQPPHDLDDRPRRGRRRRPAAAPDDLRRLRPRDDPDRKAGPTRRPCPPAARSPTPIRRSARPPDPSDTTTATRQTTVTDRDGNDHGLPVQPVQQRHQHRPAQQPRHPLGRPVILPDDLFIRHQLPADPGDPARRGTPIPTPTTAPTPPGSSRATCYP